MKIFALVFCIIGCVAGIEHISVNGSDDKPNVLVIITDEHNFRTLGCYRDTLSTEQAEMWGPGSVVETPHFDRLAKEGVLCTRAYATAPVCSPCRAAMITGMYPQNTGVPTNNAELRADVRRSPRSWRIVDTGPVSLESGIWVVTENRSGHPASMAASRIKHTCSIVGTGKSFPKPKTVRKSTRVISQVH